MADIAVTAANVLKGSTSAKTETGVAGETLTAGQVVYKDTGDANKFKKADCNSATALARVAYGIALNGAAVGQAVVVQASGLITIGGTVVVGTVYCLSSTAGGIRPVADNVAGDFVCLLGVGISATQISLNIVNSGVAIQ